MKLLSIILFLIPFRLFSQNLEFFSPDCWTEYKHENLPYPEGEHCPLILCPDNSTVCYKVEENEMYTSQEGWHRNNDSQIEIGDDGWKFNILLETNSELQLQSVEYPDFKIYLKK